MTRYVVGAAMAILVILVIGYGVHDRWFATAHAIDPGAPQLPSAKHQLAPAAPTTIIPSATVVAVVGRVEKRAGSSWVEVRTGDRLTAQDTIRTAKFASATIDVGASVVIDDRTEITIGEITETVSPVVLTEGRVSTNAGARGGQIIRVSTRDTEAVAEADAGEFDVLSSGKGHVTVAARTGSVRLTAKGAEVIVTEGTQSMVRTGEAPTAPAPIPSSLFLKVAAADTDTRTTLRGETVPGAVVDIDGQRAIADENGQFTGEVPVKKGENVIVVLVEDALGRSEKKVIRRAAPPPPKLETEVEWK